MTRAQLNWVRAHQPVPVAADRGSCGRFGVVEEEVRRFFFAMFGSLGKGI